MEEKTLERIKLLEQIAKESDEAKQIFREHGIGWTGLSLLDTVKYFFANYKFK